MRSEPYLYFRGRCLEALDFYRAALGAQIVSVVRFSDLEEGQGDRGSQVMHAVLKVGDTALLASDGQGDGPAAYQGFSLALAAGDDAEAEKVFASLSDGGSVQMPLMSTPFASRMGMVSDRFGVPWMIVTEQAPAAH